MVGSWIKSIMMKESVEQQENEDKTKAAQENAQGSSGFDDTDF